MTARVNGHLEPNRFRPRTGPQGTARMALDWETEICKHLFHYCRMEFGPVVDPTGVMRSWWVLWLLVASYLPTQPISRKMPPQARLNWKAGSWSGRMNLTRTAPLILGIGDLKTALSGARNCSGISLKTPGAKKVC